MTDIHIHQIKVRVTPYQGKSHTKVFTESSTQDCLNSLKQYLSYFDPGVRAELLDYEFVFEETEVLRFIKRELKR